ncbi:MAG: hypothetical protein MJ068_01085 [Clostridia bacterium]|nr:hypothetical protein [Clostridia bacterium]
MKKILFTIVLTLCLLVSCMFVLTACDNPFAKDEDKADATLYKLTLSTSSNVTVDQAELKATYGYGEPSATVKEGVRDSDEIAELKDAGATNADIAKAGVRQSDGSYYFFEADPIYLEAPQIDGYKLTGFFYKGTNTLAINPILQRIDGGMYLPRWNMDAKNVELEARYEKWTYTVSFDNPEDDEANPNTLNSYCYIDDGIVTLSPFTTTNTHKHFKGFEYQDSLGNWIPIVNSKLPSDYYEDYMRIHAVFETDMLSISFAFELYIDSETTQTAFDNVCDGINVRGNIATVDGEPIVLTSSTDKGKAVTATSEIKMQYGSWLEIFPSIKDSYELWKYRINDEDAHTYYDSDGYFNLYEGDIDEDSVITLVLTEKIA